MDFINSNSNRQLKLYRSLGKRKYREKLNLVPVEGDRLLADLLQRGIFPEAVYLREERGREDCPCLDLLPAETPVFRVAEKLFDRSSFTETPQGIFAVFRKPAGRLEDVFSADSLILVVDRIQDPGNLGTMLRSAAAAGAGGVVLLPGTVDPANPKAVRASMGALFALPVVETAFSALSAALKVRQIPLITAEAQARLSYDSYDWRGPAALVVGNEGSGIAAEVKAAADVSLAIPMQRKIESLNAAVAVSLMLFEAARQRRIFTGS